MKIAILGFIFLHLFNVFNTADSKNAWAENAITDPELRAFPHPSCYLCPILNPTRPSITTPKTHRTYYRPAPIKYYVTQEPTILIDAHDEPTPPPHPKGYHPAPPTPHTPPPPPEDHTTSPPTPSPPGYPSPPPTPIPPPPPQQDYPSPPPTPKPSTPPDEHYTSTPPPPTPKPSPPPDEHYTSTPPPSTPKPSPPPVKQPPPPPPPANRTPKTNTNPRDPRDKSITRVYDGPRQVWDYQRPMVPGYGAPFPLGLPYPYPVPAVPPPQPQPLNNYVVIQKRPHGMWNTGALPGLRRKRDASTGTGSLENMLNGHQGRPAFGKKPVAPFGSQADASETPVTRRLSQQTLLDLLRQAQGDYDVMTFSNGKAVSPSAYSQEEEDVNDDEDDDDDDNVDMFKMPMGRRKIKGLEDRKKNRRNNNNKKKGGKRISAKESFSVKRPTEVDEDEDMSRMPPGRRKVRGKTPMKRMDAPVALFFPIDMDRKKREASEIIHTPRSLTEDVKKGRLDLPKDAYAVSYNEAFYEPDAMSPRVETGNSGITAIYRICNKDTKKVRTNEPKPSVAG